MNCKLLFDFFFPATIQNKPISSLNYYFEKSALSVCLRVSAGAWCRSGEEQFFNFFFLNVAKMRMNHFEIISQAPGFHPSVNTSVLIWLSNLWSEFKKRKSVHKFKGDKFKKIVPPRIQVENSFISSNHIETKRQ